VVVVMVLCMNQIPIILPAMSACCGAVVRNECRLYIYIYKTMSDGYTLIRVRLSYRTCQKIIGGIYLFLIDQILTKFYQRDVWDLFILLSFV
jgi:hypothetical protein